MKKSAIFWILVAIVLCIFLISLAFNIIYFNRLHKNMRPVSEPEKERIIELLNQRVNSSDYEIKFGNVYIFKDRELAEVELIKDNSKTYYSIDIGRNRIIKR